MSVRDADIVWLDERRAAPPLELKRVNLRIENFFGRHRFALRALLPTALSTPLDLRGDFRGESLDALSEWRGQIYTRMDYTDVTAWRPWLDLPREFSRGRGALRGWLGIEQGRVNEITADMELRDVSTRLAEGLPGVAGGTGHLAELGRFQGEGRVGPAVGEAGVFVQVRGQGHDRRDDRARGQRGLQAVRRGRAEGGGEDYI